MRYKLSDLFELQMGKTPSRNNPNYWNSNDYSWVSISDMSSYDKYVSGTKEYISEQAVKESGIKTIPANTVIMSFKLSIGKTAITTGPIFSNEAIMAFIDKKTTTIDPEYIFYLFSGKNWDEGSNKAVMGKTLNKATLSNIEVDIPSLDIQKERIEKLNKISILIADKKQQLNQLDELIKARFVEMFGGPKTYPIKPLSDIAEYRNGLTYKPTDVSNDGTIVLRSSNIQNMQLDLNDIVRVKCDISNKKMVKENDILMCSRNGSAKLVGKVALIPSLQEQMSFGAFMMIIRSEYYSYLMTYFQLPEFRSQISTGTTTINQITRYMLDKVKLPVPDKASIDEFAAFVAQVDKSKFALQKSIISLMNLCSLWYNISNMFSSGYMGRLELIRALPTKEEKAKASRLVLREVLEQIFPEKSAKKKKKYSLLELIDCSPIRNYVNDDQITESLHFIRIIGIRAEHNQPVREKDVKIAVK